MVIEPGGVRVRIQGLGGFRFQVFGLRVWKFMGLRSC